MTPVEHDRAAELIDKADLCADAKSYCKSWNRMAWARRRNGGGGVTITTGGVTTGGALGVFLTSKEVAEDAGLSLARAQEVGRELREEMWLIPQTDGSGDVLNLAQLEAGRPNEATIENVKLLRLRRTPSFQAKEKAVKDLGYTVTLARMDVRSLEAKGDSLRQELAKNEELRAKKVAALDGQSRQLEMARQAVAEALSTAPLAPGPSPPGERVTQVAARS